MTSSAPIGFTPKHSQPFSLEEAMGLEIETLVTEVKRLQNSIEHLQRTQSELKDHLDSEEGKEDLEEGENGEINKAYRENEETILSQKERITLIKLALLNKLGSDARLEHYGLSLDKAPQNSTSNSNPHTGDHNQNQPIRNDVANLPREIVEIQGGGSAASANAPEDDGLHL